MWARLWISVRIPRGKQGAAARNAGREVDGSGLTRLDPAARGEQNGTSPCAVAPPKTLCRLMAAHSNANSLFHLTGHVVRIMVRHQQGSPSEGVEAAPATGRHGEC